MCYNFNSGSGGNVKTVNNGGVSSGLSIILHTQAPEYFQGKMPVGFKVLGFMVKASTSMNGKESTLDQGSMLL